MVARRLGLRPENAPSSIRITGHLTLPSRRWDRRRQLAKHLRDAAFAREFLPASIDEGADLQLALGTVIRAMGVKAFAANVRMASPSVLRAITPRHNLTQDTLKNRSGCA